MPAPATVDAIHSHDFILSRWVTSAYVEQAGIRNISGPKAKVTISNASTLRSTGAAKEKIAGMIDEGQVSFDSIFRKGTHNTLRGTLRVNQNWKITASDSGSTWVFDGLISEFGIEVPEDDVVTQPTTIDITGPVTFTAGA